MNHEPENSESSGGPKPGGAGAGEDIRTIHELVRDMYNMLSCARST